MIHITMQLVDISIEQCLGLALDLIFELDSAVTALVMSSSLVDALVPV